MEVEVDADGPFQEIETACSKLPGRGGNLMDFFMLELFPALRFDRWVEAVLSHVGRGTVTTFGGIASALGDPAAARAVGERISHGAIDGPTHRVIYSDGAVPGGSADLLSDEIELKERNGCWRIEGDRKPCGFRLKGKPLDHLRRVQMDLTPLLEADEGSAVEAVAGIDISTGKGGSAAAISIFDPGGEEIDTLCVKGELGIPYVPGYLFYREGTLILESIRKGRSFGILDDKTLLSLDGNGILHPMGFGLACQVGVITGMMSCGVAKRLLVGGVGIWRDLAAGAAISDVSRGGRRIGYAVRSGAGRPIYISSGNRISMERTLDLMISLKRHRLPEPMRRAHRIANECRKRSSETPS